MTKLTSVADPEEDLDTSGLAPDQNWEFKVDKSIYDEPVPLDVEVFTPTGLVLDVSDMEYTEWARIGGNLDRISRGHQWWGGDWHNKGEDKWSDEIWQVLDEFATNTIRNWGLVCRAFPYKDRIGEGKIDFTHFKYAADLRTLPSRRKCMRLVVENDWTTRETLDYVKEQLSDGEEDPKEKGDTTSITWTGGFNLAPADEKAGDAIAATVIDAIEKALAEAGVDARGINAFNKTFNE